MKSRKLLPLLTSILLMLSLSSCFVAKDYKRPELDLRHLYRQDGLLVDSLSNDSISIADISWKKMFTDTLLQQHIVEALDNNLDIGVALQNIYAAAAYVKQGKAGYEPMINADLNYSYSKSSENSQFGSIYSDPVNQYHLGASLSWEVDIWGKIRSRKRAFVAAYLQTIEAHKAVKTRLITSLAATYYQLLALDKKLEIAEKSVATRKSSLETTKALKAAGQVTAVAVKQTEAQVYDAQLIVVSIRQNIRLLENTFCLLSGIPSHAVERSTLQQQKIQTSLATGVPALLLENRPDVKAAEYELKETFELKNVAKSNFYPSLTITAAGGFESLQLKDWLSIQSIFGNIAGDLLQPVLNRRQIKTAYEVAQSNQQKALLHYQQILLNAGNEVSNALFDYQSYAKIIALRKQQFQAYDTAVTYSEELLNYGLANYLEVLTARQNALNSELSMVDARYQQLNAIIQLYEALGGGWK